MNSIMIYALYCWLVFITIVYLHVWYELCQPHFDIVAKLTKIKEALTEDE